jgi:hypothetical protein
MDIKFKNATGEIMEVKDHPTHLLASESGYSIENYSGELVPVAGMIRTAPNTVRMKNPEEYPPVDPQLRFNSKIFFGRLIQEFTAERWFGLSKLGIGWTMQQLVDYPNFVGLKAYANGLLMDGTIQEADALIINACLLEQGINLDNF